MPTLPAIWNVPYRRNPFFTGRADILTHLHKTLTTGQPAALTQSQAISGLGGIGKTQTAVEYAYCYGSEYRAVFWAKADSREVLVSDFVSIANVLNLPEKNEQDQNRIVNASKRWLQVNKGWLLILDNVDDLVMVDDFIPSISRGHVLLTTRTNVTEPMAQSIELDKMELEEGALFLLRRTKIIEPDASFDVASETECNQAKEISQAMDGLPLALDQAGAYILETKCGLSRYLVLYQERRIKLLKRRGRFAIDRPEPVATTWSLSFEKVEQANQAAAELLKLCAFLYADNIPEEIFSEGAPELGPILQPIAADPFELNEAIEELLRYSLVKRDVDKQTMSIHRLMQVVIKDGMNADTQKLWAEGTVRAISQTMRNDLSSPAKTLREHSNARQRLLPHSQLGAELIGVWQGFVPPAAIWNRKA